MKNWIGFEIRFSCAHFYRNPEWSLEKNREVFGKCFTEFGHGHDYRLRAELAIETLATASRDASGPGGGKFAQETEKLSERAKKALDELREELDHQHLNFVFPEFKTKIPTSENLLLFCRERLQKRLNAQWRLILWETPEIAAAFSPN